MSDTPRTDACVWRHPMRPEEECVDASIARTLEREAEGYKQLWLKAVGKAQKGISN